MNDEAPDYEEWLDHIREGEYEPPQYDYDRDCWETEQEALRYHCRR